MAEKSSRNSVSIAKVQLKIDENFHENDGDRCAPSLTGVRSNNVVNVTVCAGRANTRDR